MSHRNSKITQETWLSMCEYFLEGHYIIACEGFYYFFFGGILHHLYCFGGISM